ncbi:ABC transporter permease [Pseudoroseicyclus sp. CLL3-39]|uniref:Transport permease protein n=2 Tax=Pseudoroseicyclus tamaricis TaxID=2705421 RepID=A0A6B2JNW2_9RHOB|nr:ABC transporter permease [Pseudoroseicyclus tamaricis]
MALVLREMSSTYGRSPGGYLWQILEPAAGIMLLTLIFSLGFRSPALGSNFAIFYASGLLPFLMPLNVSSRVSGSLTYSKPLLGYPRVTILDAVMARFILNTATQVLTSILVFVFILSFWDTGTILYLPSILLGYSMGVALALGVGVMNCYLFQQLPLWRSVWSVINRPLLLISGVIFLRESMPEPYGTWMEWNPYLHVVSAVRRGFYYGYEAEYVDPLYVFGVSGMMFIVGFALLRRYHRDLMER